MIDSDIFTSIDSNPHQIYTENEISGIINPENIEIQVFENISENPNLEIMSEPESSLDESTDDEI